MAPVVLRCVNRIQNQCKKKRNWIWHIIFCYYINYIDIKCVCPDCHGDSLPPHYNVLFVDNTGPPLFIKLEAGHPLLGWL